MKDKLLKILIYLKETNSWDLAEDLAKWVFKKEMIETRMIDSLVYFLNITIKKSNLSWRQNNLIKARDMMIELRNEEEQEREDEQDKLEELINF